MVGVDRYIQLIIELVFEIVSFDIFNRPVKLILLLIDLAGKPSLFKIEKLTTIGQSKYNSIIDL